MTYPGEGYIVEGVTKYSEPKDSNKAFAQFAHRIVRAHARRIATGDIEGLTELAELADAVDAAMLAAVTGLRAEGYAWSEIGRALGVSKQAVMKRFADAQPETARRPGGQPSHLR